MPVNRHKNLEAEQNGQNSYNGPWQRRWNMEPTNAFERFCFHNRSYSYSRDASEIARLLAPIYMLIRRRAVQK